MPLESAEDLEFRQAPIVALDVEDIDDVDHSVISVLVLFQAEAQAEA